MYILLICLYICVYYSNFPRKFFLSALLLQNNPAKHFFCRLILHSTRLRNRYAIASLFPERVELPHELKGHEIPTLQKTAKSRLHLPVANVGLYLNLHLRAHMECSFATPLLSESEYHPS